MGPPPRWPWRHKGGQRSIGGLVRPPHWRRPDPPSLPAPPRTLPRAPGLGRRTLASRGATRELGSSQRTRTSLRPRPTAAAPWSRCAQASSSASLFAQQRGTVLLLRLPMAWHQQWVSCWRPVRFWKNLALNPESERTNSRFEVHAIQHCMQVEVNEIEGWDELDVSWAVLGFAGTGTTSLVMNFDCHPGLEFIYQPVQSIGLEDIALTWTPHTASHSLMSVWEELVS